MFFLFIASQHLEEKIIIYQMLFFDKNGRRKIRSRSHSGFVVLWIVSILSHDTINECRLINLH